MIISGSFIMLLFGLAQRMAMRLTYGARGPQPDDRVFFALSILNWMLFIGSVMPMIGAMQGWLGIPLAMFLVIAVIEGVVAARQLQRQTTLSLLTMASERGLPLWEVLFRHATDSGGSVARATRRLARDVEEGKPLEEAIRRHPGAVPRQTAAYLAVGSVVDDRPAALTEAGRRTPPVAAGLTQMLTHRVLYLLLIGGFMFSILTFMLVRIVPEFSKMFAEFELSLPPATEALIAASRHAGWLGYLLLLIVLQLLVIGIFFLFGVNVFRHLGDRLLPGRHRATVLRGLALAAERDQPFDPALQALAEAYPSYKWQQRLRRAAKQVREGHQWSDALGDAGLIRRSSYALVRAGERVGNLAWTLRVAADQEESREAYRWAAALQVVFPLLILLLAAIVGFICYALFVPLVELIDSLAVVA